MQLAKPALDVGLYTNNKEPLLEFWQSQPWVRYDELLKVGGGVHQHRHNIGDSILKINHTQAPLAHSPSGLLQLDIFSNTITREVELNDPDGNRLVLCPQQDSNADSNLTLHIGCSDLTRSRHYYGAVLGLPEIADSRFSVGQSNIQLAAAALPAGEVEQKALGFRYMTFQVFDVVNTYTKIISQGGASGIQPVRLGDVAYIAFVRDPDGNWIEISQRKSITGSLN